MSANPHATGVGVPGERKRKPVPPSGSHPTKPRKNLKNSKAGTKERRARRIKQRWRTVYEAPPPEPAAQPTAPLKNSTKTISFDWGDGVTIEFEVPTSVWTRVRKISKEETNKAWGSQLKAFATWVKDCSRASLPLLQKLREASELVTSREPAGIAGALHLAREGPDAKRLALWLLTYSEFRDLGASGIAPILKKATFASILANDHGFFRKLGDTLRKPGREFRLPIHPWWCAATPAPKVSELLIGHWTASKPNGLPLWCLSDSATSFLLKETAEAEATPAAVSKMRRRLKLYRVTPALIDRHHISNIRKKTR